MKDDQEVNNPFITPQNSRMFVFFYYSKSVGSMFSLTQPVQCKFSVFMYLAFEINCALFSRREESNKVTKSVHQQNTQQNFSALLKTS